MQTPRDLDDIKIESIDYKKRFPKFKGDSAFLFTLKHLITEIDNRPITFEDEEWLKNMPLADGNYILRKAEKAAAKIGEELEFEIQCPICGLTYTTPFRITPEFFGPRIDE